MTREEKIKQQRRRRIIFYIIIFAIFFAIGYGIGKIEIPVKAENTEAFVIGEGPPEQSLKSIGVYTITAYCPCRKCCGKWANGITASGTTATPNHTIAAPKSFAFGTVLIINGQEYVVEDRGGAIKGRKLDIYFDTHREALQWGRRKCEVFIYE